MFRASGLSILVLVNVCLTISLNGEIINETPPKPNIIVTMADDMGFNNVGFHGSDQIPTPNIDALGYQGQILNRHYTPNLCSPSRSSFLTGKYPIHTGMQHYVILNNEPWGLPVEEKLMSEYFQEAGYKTNLIGKWHLGLSQKNFTPPYRGFDHFRGYLGAFVDYYKHSLYMEGFEEGYDMRLNEEIDYENVGAYATDMLPNYAKDVINQHDRKDPLFLVITHLAPHTGNDDDPLQAPEEVIEKFNYISDPKRRTYAAMVSKLDDSVGEIVRTLDKNEMLDNSVILFYSDNGAPSVDMYSNSGSNFPLKGQKNGPWEGGMRVAASIWSPLLETRHIVSNLVMHNSDWLPTLGHLAGIQIKEPIDGLNLWEWLSSGSHNYYRDIVHNIDPIYKYIAFYRNGYKYVKGTTFDRKFDEWLGEVDSDESYLNSKPYLEFVKNSTVWSILDKFNENPVDDETVSSIRRSAIVSCNSEKKKYCDPLVAPCLFNVIDDPCERNNLADEEPLIVSDMELALEIYEQSAHPVNRKPGDPRSDPKYYNHTWTWWIDLLQESSAFDV